jgi:Rrf2 family transcriptional regulator, iron-sulfur cluster assembly transcription factor
MSLIFSRQCDYALQAVLYLALRPEGELTPIRQLADRVGIPYHFLGKILQKLTRKGLLRSQKGPGGGFSLGMKPREITLFRIVEAIDGVEFTKACVLGFRDCSGKSPCSVHETWAGLRQGISAMLAERTVSELARGMKKKGYAA